MDDFDALAAFLEANSIFALIWAIIMVVACWKLYEKAGQHGWASIVPVYNAYVLFKIAFGSGWFFLLLLLPIVGGIIGIVLCFKLAKAFGHGFGFGLGLLLLSPIFILVLAFGSSEYVGA